MIGSEVLRVIRHMIAAVASIADAILKRDVIIGYVKAPVNIRKKGTTSDSSGNAHSTIEVDGWVADCEMVRVVLRPREMCSPDVVDVVNDMFDRDELTHESFTGHFHDYSKVLDEMGNDAYVVLVGENPIGFISPVCDKMTGRVDFSAIWIDKMYRLKGIGRKVLTYVHANRYKRMEAVLRINWWDSNAKAFAKRCGFECDEHVGPDLDGEVLYIR